MSAALRTGLHLAEVFGPTWQGEGPHAGRRCGFVRLGLCNLSCEWCDTPFTWDRSRYDLTTEAPLTPIDVIASEVAALDCHMMVLSGGEPLVHHTRLEPLLAEPYEWHVETNGTISPPEWWMGAVDHTTVSPKINTRDPEHRRLTPALEGWSRLAQHGWATFKFVATRPADLPAIDAVVDRYAIPRDRVWVMPEGTTADAVIRHHRALAECIMAFGFNTTTRLHVLLYDNERRR